jgi:hypothetical protein
MTFFRSIFDVFSTRSATASHSAALPPTFRKRALLYCNDIFSNERAGFGYTDDYRNQFWTEIHRFLQYKLGELRLMPDSRLNPVEEAGNFLMARAGDTTFLDFVEYIFRVDTFFHVRLPEQQVIDEFNELFRVDGLPYHLTNFVKEEDRSGWDTISRGRFTIKTLAYPQIILRESDAEHQQMVAPALRFLESPAFKNANLEFLEALEAFKKNDHGNCLTHCGSAFESTLKVICQRRGWPYSQNDTAAPLVKVVIENGTLDTYFEPMLMIVATLRNRLSKSHGAGAADRRVPQHLARYAINATASVILLLIESAGEPT